MKAKLNKLTAEQEAQIPIIRWFLEHNWSAPIAAILKAEGRSDPDT